MDKRTDEKIKHSFWYYLYCSHLYTTKGEALFKAVALSISWVGGFYKTASSTAYYLFSIAIVMEYAVQLVVAKKFVPKILPIILVLSNVIVFLVATGQLFNAEKAVFAYQYIIEIITMIIIWIDAILTVLIEPPDECKIETTLSSCKISQLDAPNDIVENY